MTLDLAPGLVIKASWIAFILYWIVAALNVKATRRREAILARALNSALLLLAAILMSVRSPLPGFLLARFVPLHPALEALGAVMTVAGLAFAIWARLHLGREWSGNVTVKDDHVLIRSGPYASLRHPIYSGVLLALAGTALDFGEWRGLAALVLFLVAVLRRIAAEEALMREAFPGYDQYRRTSWALIPFVF